MKTVKILLMVIVLMCLFSGLVYSKTPGKSLQTVVVTTPDWNSHKAKITLYERKSAKSPWKEVGESFDAVIGKNGMGWGRGIYDYNDAQSQPFRKEGDKRAPAGIFTVSETFGALSPADAKKHINLKMPYIQLKDGVKCIDDSHSQYYNTIVDTTKVKPDWSNNGYEDMYKEAVISADKVYRWGLFIDHNSDKNPFSMKKEMFAGSCIFLHVWEGSDIGTSGCTAAEEKNIVKILKWIDSSKNPVFVQLPDSEYVRLREKWNLP